MSGEFLPHSLQSYTDASQGQQQQRQRPATVLNSASRIQLPPPLPPVNETGSFLASTRIRKPLSLRPLPIGHLAPLRGVAPEEEKKEESRTLSPLPRPPPPPPRGDPPTTVNSVDDSAPNSRVLATNPLFPHSQQDPSNDSSKETFPRAAATSAKSRRPATGRATTHDGQQAAVSAGEETAETLCPLPPKVGPLERFFVECRPNTAVENINKGVEIDEDELLFDRLAEYTDDDSFFSSGDLVIEEDPRRLQKDQLRGRAVRTAYETLNLRALTQGRMPQDLEDMKREGAGWMYQVHQRAIALHHSSFFIFPPGMKARVVAYNLMHHWLMELLIICIIIGYSIFTACWSRHSFNNLEKPEYMVFADVFYTFLYGIEIIVRMFASGLVLHPRAYLRSPWHLLDVAVFILMILNCTSLKHLWNFTAFRLIRVVKSFTYLPIPKRIKLLSKALLCSTRKLFYVSVIIVYALLFFALLGLQIFRGTLHHRCVDMNTRVVTSQLCRPGASGESWLYWGHVCDTGFVCADDLFPNPHYDFRSFDDIGHAFLSTFQIMTFQGWTSLLQETNDAVSTVAILYYIFTIICCAWFISSLYVGVFLEKIEKTSRYFLQKQLQLFDSVLVEQRQRMNKAVKLRDFVERDKSGNLQPNVFEVFPGDSGDPRNVNNHTARNTEFADEASVYSTNTEGQTTSNGGNIIRRRTKWTNEQRVQLHLSLTRQRNLAEPTERTRRVALKLPQNDLDAVERGGVASASSSIRQGRTDGRFALGGRVGVVQHHPLTHTIGAAHGTDLPLAVRLENEKEQLRFLSSYQYSEIDDVGARDVAVTSELCNAASANTTCTNHNNSNNDTTASAQALRANTARHNVHYTEDTAPGILATRESAGVIPNRYSLPPGPGIMGRMDLVSAHNSAMPSDTRNSAGEFSRQLEVLIHDPEGGDFRYAKTCCQRLAIVRNILHMFTEGYPRILTQYLWEHRNMQQGFGILPLDYMNKYEEAALRKLRQQRALRDKHKNSDLINKEKNDDECVGGQEKDFFDGLSPICMARNIVENAPVTVFNSIMLFLAFANGVFNASRHYGQPAYWDDALFIAGVCFTSLFTLEIIIRLVALGPGPYFFDMINVLCFFVTLIGFFELGFFRSNSITVLNWVQFLKLFRLAPFAQLRRVTRVLLLGFSDIVYALIIFSVFVFMWVLLGMSFFGGHTELLDRGNDDYNTRGFFDTFASSTFAVAQAFSYNREEWLFMSWDGMRARGGYTVLYFIAVVGVSFIFRFLFIAIFVWAWHREEEREDSASQEKGVDKAHKRRGQLLRWFDFTVWRSFKHIHGGFRRRDVAPDEVFHLNQDMRRQLRLAEAKERFSREAYLRRGHTENDHKYTSTGSHFASNDRILAQGPQGATTPQFVNIGGRLQRLMDNTSNLPAARVGESAEQISSDLAILQLRARNAQLRFARRYDSSSTTLNPERVQEEQNEVRSMSPSSSSQFNADGLNANANLTEHPGGPFSLPHERQNRPTLNTHTAHADGTSATGRRSSVTGHFITFDYERQGNTRNNYGVRMERIRDDGTMEREAEMDAERMVGEDIEYKQGSITTEDRQGQVEDNSIIGGKVFEHVLLPGPRLRYKHVMKGRHRRTFERCLDCNAHKQMPLRAPPNVEQRTADELHAEHCHMAAVRSSRQLILNTITGYVRLQKELGEPPTRDAVETVLGQAWSCGMLLFETIEYLSCVDIEKLEDRTWDRTLEALQLQEWLIGLQVGEEQVGRATLAYILAHQTIQAREVTYKSFWSSWRERSLLLFLPDNPFRIKVTQVVKSKWFEWFIIAIIFVASICLCFYEPFESRQSAKYVALHAFDSIFAIIFLIEVLLKWVSMGVLFDAYVAYFWHKWNILDFFVTIISLIAIAPQYSHLRFFKVMRCFYIFRPLRHCKFNEELSKLAITIWNCVPILANTLLLCLVNYVVWAILAVRLFMGLMHSCRDQVFTSKKSCLEVGELWNGTQRNFDNFHQSLLTMFEVSTGSRWLDVIYSGVDGWSTNHAPKANRYPLKGFFFIVYYYLSNFVLFSLFIASLIYCYLLAKNAVEGVAGITFEHQLWIRMQRMILRLKPRVQLLPQRNFISRFLHGVVMHRAFELVMSFVLLFNLITMSLYWYGNSPTQEKVLDGFQHLWVSIFTLELILRAVAHGMRAFSRWSFCFGVFVTFLSYLQIVLNTTSVYKVPFNVNVLRLLQFGRILNLVDLLPVRHHLHLLYEVLLLSAPGLVCVTVILLLGVFVFAVMGMHFLGQVLPVAGGFIDKKYNNFMTFPSALMMTFRLATLEDWVAMLRSSVSDGNFCEGSSCNTTNWAPVFYVATFIFFILIVVTLYVAIVVDHYGSMVRMNASVTRIQDLQRFRVLWSEYDPNATLVIRTKHLPKLLEALRPPLGLSSRRNRAELLRLLREYDIADHGGKVHYYDVLLPLARRVLAMAFNEDVVNDGTTFEVLWRITENTLRELPTVLTVRGNTTAAEHFAASYAQAVCRRRMARRLMQQLRADLWSEGRAVCDELGLPYENYGVGVVSLRNEQPVLDGMRWAPSEPEYSESGETVDAPMSAARLPGQYQPAIDEIERRFGPEVPNAVRRHETRSDKLRRKEDERQCRESTDTSSSPPACHRSGSQRPHGSDYQPPLGTDPNEWLKDEGPRQLNVPGMSANYASAAAPPSTSDLASLQEGGTTVSVGNSNGKTKGKK